MYNVKVWFVEDGAIMLEMIDNCGKGFRLASAIRLIKAFKKSKECVTAVAVPLNRPEV